MSRSFRGFTFKPLPSAAEEARAIAKLLGVDGTLLLGAEAREQELKSVVSPRILHLATHGFYLSDQEFKQTNALPFAGSSAFTRPGSPESGTPHDWENPLIRCGIALAGANYAMSGRSAGFQTGLTGTDAKKKLLDISETKAGWETGAPAPATKFEEEDGLLTGLEASLLNLQGTKLVILSACQTGAGEIKIGEGVMSLRRAFTIAGAESVLASHWPVSDKATSQLMTEFMRRQQSGEPRAKAWREAQLALLRSKDFANPYFWAAFTLTGQWR